MSRWFLAGLLLLSTLVGGVYFFSTQIFARVVVELAAERGLTLEELTLQRPGLHGIRIDRVVGDIDTIHLVATGIEISYALESLLAQPIEAIAIRDLQVRVDDAPATPAPTPAQSEPGAQSAFDPAVIFGIVPRLSVARFLLEIVKPGFVGTGSLKVNDDSAQFELSGVEPDFARELVVNGLLQSNGSLQFSFFDATQPDSPFLQLHATPTADQIDLRGDYDLSGYPLSLVTGLLNLPSGTGRLQGHLTSRLESLDIAQSYQDLNLAGSYQIDWNDEFLDIQALHGQLSGSLANLASTVEGGVIEVSQAAVRFTVDSGTTVQYADKQISIGPGMTAILQNIEAADFQSVFTHTAIDLHGAGPSIKTNATFSATAFGLQTQGEMTADIAVATNTVVADLNVNVADLGLPLHLTYDIDSRRGSVAGESQWSSNNLAHSVIQNWPYNFDIASGDVGIELQGALVDGVLNGRVVVGLAGSKVRYEDFEFLDTAASLDFAFGPGGVRLQPSTIAVGEFDFGLVLQDVEIGVGWHDDAVELFKGHFDLLGGNVTIAPAKYDLTRNKANLDLTVANLDLAQVMALEGDDIQGEGRLYGTLPVRVNDGKVSMTNGQIYASEAGGVIQISPKFNLGTGQPGIDFAMQALANFEYQTLTAVANYAENGDLELAVGLQGRNPEIEKGRPIHYNLNINENIFSLIDALNAETGVTERVERGVMKKKGS
jgi:hypothetical protein